MSLALRCASELRTLGFAAILAGYVGVGTPIGHAARQIYIQNFTDADLMFSLNGVDDAFPIAANSFFLSDITANKTLSQGFFLPVGQRLYVKQLEVPTKKSVYFTIFYGTTA